MSERSNDDIRADIAEIESREWALTYDELTVWRLATDARPLLDRLLVVEGELAEANRKLAEVEQERDGARLSYETKLAEFARETRLTSVAWQATRRKGRWNNPYGYANQAWDEALESVAQAMRDAGGQFIDDLSSAGRVADNTPEEQHERM